MNTPAIYQIDFNTCTAQDVIERSIVAHPSLLEVALRNAVDTHWIFAQSTHDHTAAQAALKLGRECRLAADNVRDNRVDLIMHDMGQWISALNCAAKLQLIPHHCLDGIASRKG
jgi:hypothetical protein